MQKFVEQATSDSSRKYTSISKYEGQLTHALCHMAPPRVTGLNCSAKFPNPSEWLRCRPRSSLDFFSARLKSGTVSRASGALTGPENFSAAVLTPKGVMGVGKSATCESQPREIRAFKNQRKALVGNYYGDFAVRFFWPAAAGLLALGLLLGWPAGRHGHGW
jgi:hypothetical protein